MNNYYVFTTIDPSYIDVAFVCITSIRRFTDFPVHIHCVNFSDDEYIRTMNLFSRFVNIELVMEQIHVTTATSTANDRLYCKHMDAMSSKIVIFNRHYKPYMVHIDMDMVFLRDPTFLFKEYSSELIGFEYYGDTINAGFMILHTDKNFDFDQYSTEYIRDNINVMQNLEENFINTHVFTKELLPESFFYDFAKHRCISPRTVFIHYNHNNKPWIPSRDIGADVLWCMSYDKWYEIYNSIDKSIVPTLSDGVELTKSMVSKIIGESIQ